MLGKENGAAQKLVEMCSPAKPLVMHAVAHVEQLAMGTAFKLVDYYEEWEGIVREVMASASNPCHSVSCFSPACLCMRVTGVHVLRAVGQEAAWPERDW